MNYRPLGSTGLQVSEIALGTVKFGRTEGVKYPEPFDLPSDDQILELLGAAREAGINLVDTAPAYGLSEERLGELLPNVPGDWLISTKAGETFSNGESSFDFRPEALRASVRRSLQRLGREVLDIVLLHSDGNDVQILNEYGALDTLLDLRSQGLVRAVGLSGKTVAGGLLALEQGADVVMVTRNLAYHEEDAVIDRAHELNRGVLIKKALNSGNLDRVTFNPDTPPKDAAAESIRHVLAHPGVSSIVIGTLKPDRIRQNARVLESR